MLQLLQQRGPTFGAILDLEPAIAVRHRQVPGVKPALREGLLGRCGVLEVALHHDVPADHDLAQRAAVCRHLRHSGRVQHMHSVLHHCLCLYSAASQLFVFTQIQC